MTEGNSKEFEMAVGTSAVLESGMMEGDNFYTPMESANETETASQSNWTAGKPPDTGQLCRSCANTSDYLIPIFEGEGLEHQLEYKIQKHLPIQVSSTDTLPLQLCYQCASTLIAWDAMISSCLEAEKKLKAIQEAAEECKNRELFEDSHVEGDTEMVDSDDEPLITSKTKLLSEKNKATPIKKKILSKAKSKTITIKNDKTATNSKEDEDKERWGRSNSEKTDDNIEIMKKRKFPKEMESISVLSTNGALISIYRCKLCGHKTNRSNNLKAHLQTHKRVLPYKCENCGRKYQKRQDGKDHLNSIEIVLESVNGRTKKLYRCKLCGHTSNRSNNLKKHLGSHESMQELRCEMCGGKCRESNVSNYHVKEIEVVSTQDEEGKERKSFRCKICGETFSRMASLRSHITSHKPIQIHVCRVCGKEYLGGKSLKEHALTAHGDAAAGMTSFPYKCEYCDQLFTEKNACEEHRETHAGEKPYICHMCNCAFRTRSSLYLHSKIHAEQRPYPNAENLPCNLYTKSEPSGGRSTKKKGRKKGKSEKIIEGDDGSVAVGSQDPTDGVQLNSETAKRRKRKRYPKETDGESAMAGIGEKDTTETVVAKEKPMDNVLICHVCSKEFKKVHLLHAHIRRVHERIVVAKCEVCGRDFRDTSNYTSHMKIHSNVKSYVCQHCGKCFAQVQGLKIHHRTHTLDFPHLCIVCGRRYRTRQHLDQHASAHSDERPFECDACGKSFKTRLHLKAHSWIHSDRFRYYCSYCQKGFNNSSHMRLHIRNHHTEVKLMVPDVNQL